MAILNHNGKNIYYEVHGEGDPLVIFNGIMMSTTSWSIFLPELTKNNQVILFDFFDQGQSDKVDYQYTQDLQVEVAEAVINHLDLEKINLFGISYGGEVAMHYALKNKAQINKLLLFNTTAWTNPWLADIGRGWVQAAETGNKELFYNATIPIIYSPMFYTRNIDWMNERKNFLYEVFTEEFLNGMIRLINSAEFHNIKDRLSELNGIKTLIVGCEHDFITPENDQKLIRENIPGSELVILRDCGHASMYESPASFLTLVKGFIAN